MAWGCFNMGALEEIERIRSKIKKSPGYDISLDLWDM